MDRGAFYRIRVFANYYATDFDSLTHGKRQGHGELIGRLTIAIAPKRPHRRISLCLGPNKTVARRPRWNVDLPSVVLVPLREQVLIGFKNHLETWLCNLGTRFAVDRNELQSPRLGLSGITRLAGARRVVRLLAPL